ncbi:conjugal transfer protein TraG, partial [Enterococcus faecium]
MKPDEKKLLILNQPYRVFGYLFANCAEAYRQAAGG